MRFFQTPNIDFIGMRRRAMMISVALLLIGIVSVVAHKGLRQSIDFAGGSLVEIQLQEPVPLTDLRAIMADAGYEGAEVTNFGTPNEYLIKVKAVGQAAAVAKQIKELLAANIDQEIDMRRTESVGPKIGSELRTAMLWAIVYSLLGIVAYITWRFEFRFAIAAIVALIHDVLFTLGFFSLAGMEVSLAVIAAILTIVGDRIGVGAGMDLDGVEAQARRLLDLLDIGVEKRGDHDVGVA